VDENSEKEASKSTEKRKSMAMQIIEEPEPEN